ncbi:hypothetical protein GGR97_000823 [Wenyingzhuangia aestuarii]|nr:hypothetical protein [Wenyingzhuangia aestuarii]
MENNQVEITSIGLGSSVHKYLVTDLNIKEMPNESKKNTTFVKVCNSNGELLFLCSSDFLNTDELQNSEFKFLNELGKKLIT